MSVEERALYEEMRQLPDFSSYPLPLSWIKAFNLPEPTICSVPEFIKSGYTNRRAWEHKTLPPLIINKPQQNGKLVVAPEADKTEVTITSQPFIQKEGELFPVILPSLVIAEDEEKDECPCQTECLEQKCSECPLPKSS